MRLFAFIVALILSAVSGYGQQLDWVKQIKNKPFVDVREYGAKGDGTTDDTTAIQATINAVTTGGTVFFPKGRYKITGTLSVTSNGVGLLGAGSNASTIYQANPARSIFNVATQFPGPIRELALHYSSGSPGQSGTSAITLTGPAGYEGYNGLIENVYISWAYDAIILNAVPYTVLKNVWVQYTQHFGISIYNTINPDNGDITLEGLRLIQDPLTLGNIGVYQASSGGLRFTNSKIIGFDYAYDLEYNTPGLNTSIVMIQNNSFEGQTATAIRLGGSTGIWSRFLITGNQMDTYTEHSWNCMVVANTNFDGVFSGNMCSGYGAVRNPSTYPATGIYFVDTAENWVVSGNTFTSLDTGVYIGANAKNIHVGKNNWGTTSAKNLVTTACTNSSYSSSCGNQLLEGLGPTLAITSNTVSPTHSVHVLGAGLLKTITVGQAVTPGACVNFIPAYAFTYDATGNIVVPAGGGTATINRVMTFCYHSLSGKFYPSY